MNSIQSSSYKASLRSKIAVRADELFPGDSLDAIKERITFTRKMYRMILEEKNIDLFWFFPLSNINPFFLINMQVTSSVTVVDYYPEAFIAEADDIKGMKTTVKRFIKRVTWRKNGLRSYSVVNATDARYDWQSRINNGATVTNFNTDKMDRSEYMPMSCW